MSTRKSMKLPIIITVIFICIIVYLFTNIKQTIVTCHKTKTYDSDIKLKETITSSIDNKRISKIELTKKIILPQKYPKKEETLNGIKNALEKTLEYLKDDVSIDIVENTVVAHILVDKNQVVMLNNIEFQDNDGEIQIKIDANTKSSNAITLKVGDNYSDGELLKKLKNNGYSCQ